MTKSDYGEYLGFGFKSFESALSTVDPDNPNIGDTYKIMGRRYELESTFGRLAFKEVNDG